MARSRRGRVIDGMLLLDKPAGMSSNRALQQVRSLLDARKAGHTGSLDPIATGLLPLCFGQCTKISGMFLESDKRYTATIKLGVTTDSGDREGEVVQRSPVDFTYAELGRALKAYTGDLLQTPPMYSALKRNGQPLYKLARQGIEVEREPREVRVYQLDLLDANQDSLVLDIRCSKGFYVRSLAMDLGERLGCGGHVSDLRRTAVGLFSIDQAVSMDELEAISSQERLHKLIAVDQALAHLPEITLDAVAARQISRGQRVTLQTCPRPGLARIYADNGPVGAFIGIGEVDALGQVVPKRIFASQEE